ncbi:MAG: hydroxymethylpyrimidine/phosphomethylpyrimidine kinase [Gemmatimonadetes bacterium]|nr:hydroxymethylpyrimidine/phosphomethylpyrimidine kinase [Gemmatimonadota bacterium]
MNRLGVAGVMSGGMLTDSRAAPRGSPARRISSEISLDTTAADRHRDARPASSGDRLLEDDAVALVARLLIPMASLITPNSQEAAILTGSTIENQHDMAEAALKLQDMGAGAVLVKGGHINGDKVTDLLRFESQTRSFSHERIDTTSTHGTGCTLSAAITAELANGRSIVDAVETGLNFVNRAIAAAPSLGAGHGPLNHFVSVK